MCLLNLLPYGAVANHTPSSSLLPLVALLQDALEYGLIDEIIQPNAEKVEKAAAYWLKSGRAESDGRLEQWKEYLELQEKYSMKDQFRKVRAEPQLACSKYSVDADAAAAAIIP